MNIKKCISCRSLPSVCALVHWCIVLFLHLDRLFFRNDERTSLFWIPKICLLLFLLTAWHFVFRVIRKLLEKDPQYVRGAQIFGVYFLIMLGLLLILWPGTFSWDDAITLNVISYYNSFFPEQHILTGVYQDVLLHLLPLPGGLILLQNCIIAICVSFCVVKLETLFSLKSLKNPFADIFLKLLPFLLPPVLLYQFSGYRMGLYIYLELTMLCMLLSAWKENTPWRWSYLLLFCFLGVIVSVWRTEAMVYIPFLIILLLLMSCPLRRKILCSALILCGFFTLTQLQNHAMNSENYQLISLTRPATELVRCADPQKDAEELEDIGAVLSLDVINSRRDRNGEQLYWDGDLTREFSQEEYSAFVKALVKLAIKYPKTIIKERWDLFIEGSGLTGKSSISPDASQFFDEDFSSGAKRVTISKNWLAFRPIFPQLRKQLVNLLIGRTAQGEESTVSRLIFNAILPELVLIAVWIQLLLRKKWYPWLICSAVLAKLGIVFLTEPAPWLMYVLSFYLLGYVCLEFVIWNRFGAKKGSAQ